MKTTRVIAAAGVLALALWPGRGGAQAPKVPTIEEITARLQQRQDASKTFRIRWTQSVLFPKGACSKASPKDYGVGEVFPPTDTTLPGHGSVVMDGEKARLENHMKIVNTVTKSFSDLDILATYDGKTGALLHDSGSAPKRMSRQPDPSPRMLVTTNTSPFLPAFRPLGVGFGGWDPNELRVTGRTALVNGAQCIEVGFIGTTPTAGTTLWLDPGRDYHLVRYQQYGSGQYALTQYDIDYTADAPGRWRPAGWVSIFQLQGGHLYRRVKASVTECAVGERVSSGEFSTEPPPNTRVEDSSGPDDVSRFVVRPDGSRRDVLPDERNQPFDVLVRTEPGEPLDRPVRSWWGRNWMFIAGAGAAVAGAAGLIGVARRRRLPKP
ncbi:MAG: hypothetical protein K2X82_32470 [Gemmataceae bacterium]|nr:hypothetical protein [Gemmataceae bacterium]